LQQGMRKKRVTPHLTYRHPRPNVGITSVVVSKFAHPLYGALANFETETTLGFNKLLVSFDSEIRKEHDIEMVRISESGH